jgi:hypothetical protein
VFINSPELFHPAERPDQLNCIAWSTPSSFMQVCVALFRKYSVHLQCKRHLPHTTLTVGLPIAYVWVASGTSLERPACLPSIYTLTSEIATICSSVQLSTKGVITELDRSGRNKPYLRVTTEQCSCPLRLAPAAKQRFIVYAGTYALVLHSVHKRRTSANT